MYWMHSIFMISLVGIFEKDKCVQGDIYLASEGFRRYVAEFKGGDDIVNGFRVYDEVSKPENSALNE